MKGVIILSNLSKHSLIFSTCLVLAWAGLMKLRGAVWRRALTVMEIWLGTIFPLGTMGSSENMQDLIVVNR